MSIATFLQGVSPFGPIFGKELRTTARRKRTYFLRVVYLAILLVPMVFISYMVTARMGQSAGVAAQNQQRSEIGQIFFACFSVSSTLMMGLFGPILTATAISSERLQKTLPVLLMTPITAWQIVAGKLFSRLLVSLTLIGLGLPILAMVRLLGGVELGQMIGAVALAVVAAISSAAIGLFFSSLLNRAYAVILLSFGAMMFLYLFIPFVIVMGSQEFMPRLNELTILQFIWSINPYFMVFAVAIPDITARMTGSLPWGWCIGSHLGLTILLVFLSAMILRRRARREGEGSPGISAAIRANTPAPRSIPPLLSAGFDGMESSLEMPTIVPSASAPGYAPPKRKKLQAARAVSDNPILWREMRRPLMPRRWQRILAVCICAFMLVTVYALIALNGYLSNSELLGGWACVFNFLIAGIALVISSTAISQEKESDTWTLMLATPVSGWTIVMGKALGITRRMFWPMILVSAHFLTFAAFGVINFAEAIMAVWIIITFNSLWIATGVYFSLRLSKVTFAVIANFTLVLFVYLFVSGALAILTVIDFSYRATGEAEWMYIGACVLFAAALAWWAFAVFLCVRSPRGGIGHFIIATMFLTMATMIFVMKMNGISERSLSHQAGWYVPYYFLGQIGHSRSLRLWLPNSQTAEGVVQVLGIVFAVGAAHLLAACGLLSMTAWKFNGLVGRAPQLRPLAINDRRDAGERTVVKAGS